MKRVLCWLLASLICGGALHAQEEPSDAPDAASPSDASAPVPARTNTPPPALVGFVVTAGTGAWILSGVDWSSDDEDPESGVLAAPTLTTPEAGAEVSAGTITFRWKAVKGADSYLLDVDACAEPGVCGDFRLERVFGLSFTMEWPAGVPAGRWRVRAIDADNLAGRWSEFRSFTIAVASE